MVSHAFAVRTDMPEKPKLLQFSPTGAKDAKRLATNFTRMVVNALVIIMLSIASVLKPGEVKKLKSQATDDRQRFSDAMSFYGVDEKGLQSRIRGSAILFYVFLAGATVDLVFIGRCLVDYGVRGIAGVLPGLGFLFMLSTLVLKYGFANYQLRTRSLSSFASYLKSSNMFLPAFRIMPAVTLVAVAAMGMFPSLAHAETSFSTSAGSCATSVASLSNIISVPCSSDLWLQTLQYIFPNIGPLGTNNSSASTGAGGLVATITAFLSVLMTVGTGVMGWHFISGTVATAHEGTVLGQKFHTVWAPLRLCYGVGMLAPTAKGVCLAQVFALYVALWSGSFGNVLWGTYVQNISQVTLASGLNLPETTGVVKGFAQAEMCYALNSLYEAQNPRVNAVMPAHPDTYTVTSSETTSPAALDTPYAPYSSLAASHGSDLARSTVQWDYGPCGKITGEFNLKGTGTLNGAAKQFDASKLAAIKQLQTKMNTDTKAIAAALLTPSGDNSGVSTGTDPLTKSISTFQSDIVATKQAFDTAVGSAAAAYESSLTNSAGQSYVAQFQSTVASKGWMTAGAYYMTAVRLQHAVADVLKTNPTFETNAAAVNAMHTDVMKALSEDGKGGLTRVQEAIDTAMGTIADNETAAQTGAVVASAQAQSLGLSNALTKLFTPVTNMVQEYVSSMTEIQPGKGAALQQMVNEGHDILDVAVAIGLLMLANIFTGGLIASAGSSFLGRAAGALTGGMASSMASAAGGLIQAVSGLGLMLALGLLGVGILFAYIIPMMPFIQFMFFVLGCIVLVCEAMIATPLWAFMHIRMDGSELIDGHQRSGYVILFNMFMRIPMGIFGLILSMGIFETILWCNAQLFPVAVTAATADNAEGPVGFLAMLAISSYMQFQFALKSFSIITSMPVQVARWFGASGDAMQEDESSKAAMQFAMGQMTGNLTSLINKGRTNLSAGAKKGSTDRPTSGPEKEEGEQETGTEQLPGA